MRAIEILMSEGMEDALNEIANDDDANLHVKRIYCPINPEHKRFSFYAKTDLDFGPDGSFIGLAQGHQATSDFDFASGCCVECAGGKPEERELVEEKLRNLSQNMYGQCIIEMHDGRKIITGGISACRQSGFIHAVGNPFEKEE